jgi:hypothetical protein
MPSKLLLLHTCQPPNLPEICDGCGQTNSVGHALDYNTSVLVIERHNEIANELAGTCVESFTPSAVHDEPSIYPEVGNVY